MSLLLPLTLATILTTDPLGYECVPEQYLEAAFALSGKGVRSPQTCIPEPCEEVFSELTLADYSGFQDDALYRDYRSRMTKVCGASSIWEEKGLTDEELLWAVFDGGSPSIALDLPMTAGLDIPDLPALWTAAETPKGGGSGGWNGTGGGGFGGGGTGGGGSTPNSGGQPGGGTGGGGTPPGKEAVPGTRPEVPIQTPLPAPFFLLSAAAGALLLVKRSRRTNP